jgi:hypothetical protein
VVIASLLLAFLLVGSAAASLDTFLHNQPKYTFLRLDVVKLVACRTTHTVIAIRIMIALSEHWNLQYCDTELKLHWN